MTHRPHPLTFPGSHDSRELHAHEVLDGCARVVYGLAHYPSVHRSHQGAAVVDLNVQSDVVSQRGFVAGAQLKRTTLGLDWRGVGGRHVCFRIDQFIAVVFCYVSRSASFRGSCDYLQPDLALLDEGQHALGVFDVTGSGRDSVVANLGVDFGQDELTVVRPLLA